MADEKGAEAPPGTRERILDAAEALLRRHGPAKTTVVDVARSLGMSHANVYRHFASKAELQDAVAERWLHRVSGPLAEIAGGTEPAPERLARWLAALHEVKRRKVLDDPEMFATYHAVAQAAREVVAAHVAELRAQLAAILRDGAASGDFAVRDPEAAAATVFDATTRFHHPHQVLETAAHDTSDDLRRVTALLVAGLRAGAV